MMIDARSLPVGTKIRTAVCIVGAGPAGITISRELSRLGIENCLVEAGGLDFSAESQSHYLGEVEYSPYDLVTTRTRHFGGSSNCWAGWSRPFDEIDMEARFWVPNSGWPIGLDVLKPYYPRANEALQLPDAPYDLSYWAEHGQAHDAPLIQFNGSGLTNVISQLSPPTRFGFVYRHELSRSGLSRVLLHATASEIVTNEDGTRATGVRINTAADRTIGVEAGIVVLALGGIENARLLLLSRKARPAGLGNDHDVVGRYFMDHPRIRMGRLYLQAPRSYSRFYDVTYYYGNRRFARAGTQPAASIGFSREVQRERELLQCHIGFIGSYLFESSPRVDSGKRLYKALTRNNTEPLALADVRSAVIGLPLSSTAWLARQTRSRRLTHHFELQSVLEAAPDPDNRVTLNGDRDRFGINRVKLRWKVGEMEKRSHQTAIALLGREVEALGIGRVEMEPEQWGDDWDRSVMTTWHHMGTTRMHQDPRKGVVDEHCRVHSVANLYIAGSSVFTTGGGNMPTINIIALALRLAERLKNVHIAR
ncbi:GMC oxidoreductase [Sphingomonas oleivorans]|nr:GMC family oxidoreductase [Sphingomonas oleivorans]